MCDCYRIGGPFVAEDPECPTHGIDARRRQDEFERLRTDWTRAIDSHEADHEELRRRVHLLEGVVHRLLERVEDLEADVCELRHEAGLDV